VHLHKQANLFPQKNFEVDFSFSKLIDEQRWLLFLEVVRDGVAMFEHTHPIFLLFGIHLLATSLSSREVGNGC